LRKLALACVGVAMLGATASVSADDQDVIDYRVHVMKSMGEDLDAIGMILAKKAPADNLTAHVKALAVIAPQAKKAFEPKVPGGQARPEVWSNWADFAKRLDALVASTDALAKVADGGAAAVADKVKSVDCKGCHDTYMSASKS